MRCGSPGYIAPEILNYIDGNKIYNEKVDIFSLGVTFFVMYNINAIINLLVFMDFIQSKERIIWRQ
jgi:serine/threonine protein kinase